MKKDNDCSGVEEEEEHEAEKRDENGDKEEEEKEDNEEDDEDGRRTINKEVPWPFLFIYTSFFQKESDAVCLTLLAASRRQYCFGSAASKVPRNLS